MINVHPFAEYTLTSKQLAMSMLPQMEGLYGGSAGGGKSDYLLWEATKYLTIPGFSAILFRKTLTDHELPSGLIPRSHKMLGPIPEARWDGSKNRWQVETTWPDGTPGPPSTLQFGYIGEVNAQLRYQSSEYQYIGWDEVTHHAESDYTYLFSRLRRCVCPVHKVKDGKPNYVDGCMKCSVYKKLPLKVRAATNPGGPGHSWVINRFGITAIKDENGELATDEHGHKMFRAADPKERPFIQSFLEDNPFIDQESYRKSLLNLDPLEQARLLHGDWSVNPDARFQISDFRTYRILPARMLQLSPSRIVKLDDLEIIATMDSAASSRDGMTPDVSKDERSWSVISVFGMTEDKHLLWLDMDRFQAEVPDVIRRFKIMLRKWPGIKGYAEKNGVGMAVYQDLARTNFPVLPINKVSDKVVNASEAMVRVKQGRIWLPEAATWLKEVTDEVSSWTGTRKETDDIIDTLADAARVISWGEAGVALDLDGIETYGDQLTAEVPFVYGPWE